jgi:hypothetical protein
MQVEVISNPTGEVDISKFIPQMNEWQKCVQRVEKGWVSDQLTTDDDTIDVHSNM